MHEKLGEILFIALRYYRQRRIFATNFVLPRLQDNVKLPLRSSLLRFSAAVLLGSIGVGVMSPVLAAGDIEERLSAEGFNQEALDAALHAAESGSPADVADAVTTAMGDEAPATKAVLHALYGQLYQLLQFQQGPKAVASALATSQIVEYSGFALTNLTTRLPAPNVLVEGLQATESATPLLPRFAFPAVKPRAPNR